MYAKLLVNLTDRALMFGSGRVSIGWLGLSFQGWHEWHILAKYTVSVYIDIYYTSLSIANVKGFGTE